MFEFTYELVTVAASNPHFIFLVCNLIIVTLILVSLEPTSSSHNHHKHTTPTPIPIPSSPPNVTNQNKTTQNVFIDVVDKVSYDSNLSVHNVSCDRPDLSVADKVSYDCNISVEKVSYDCNLMVQEDEELLEDDELRRRVEEFIDKINSGWKAEKMSLIYDQLNSSSR